MNNEQIIQKLYETFAEFTPETIDILFGAVRIQGFYNIGLGVILFLIVLAPLCYRKKIKERLDNVKSELDILISTIFFVLLLSILIYSSIFLFSIWNWVAIFSPELALAKHILGL